MNTLTTVTNNYTPAQNFNPFFEVSRCPIHATLNNETKEIERDALFSPNGDLLGIVSPKYKLVTNREVQDVFDEYFSGLKIHSVKDKVSSNGGKWIRDYIINEDDYTVSIGKSDDVIKTKVSIINGYDGQTSVGMIVSAWRQICSNGMMGWGKILGKKFSHFTKDIIGQLDTSLKVGYDGLKDNFGIWEQWTEVPFTEKEFKGFIDSRSYLSDKQKETTSGLYLPVKTQFKEPDTKWGAYNVITAMATHHTKSRNKKVDNEFSNGYKTMARLAKDFYGYNVAA